MDFVCLSRRLIVELDGGQHAEPNSQDEARDAFLRREGFRVLRDWNNEMLENPSGVIESILKALRTPGYLPAKR